MPKIKERHAKSCKGKCIYRTRDKAERGRKRLKSVPEYDGRPLATYLCSACGYWHVGHIAKNRLRKAQPQ